MPANRSVVACRAPRPAAAAGPSCASCPWPAPATAAAVASCSSSSLMAALLRLLCCVWTCVHIHQNNPHEWSVHRADASITLMLVLAVTCHILFEQQAGDSPTSSRQECLQLQALTGVSTSPAAPAGCPPPLQPCAVYANHAATGRTSQEAGPLPL
jgi:hypothetical protein